MGIFKKVRACLYMCQVLFRSWDPYSSCKLLICICITALLLKMACSCIVFNRILSQGWRGADPCQELSLITQYTYAFPEQCQTSPRKPAWPPIRQDCQGGMALLPLSVLTASSGVMSLAGHSSGCWRCDEGLIKRLHALGGVCRT